MRCGIKGEDVDPKIPQLKKIIRGLFFSDQSDPRQNFYANDILESFLTFDFGNPMTRNWQKFVKYVQKNWFRPNMAHFIGQYSNFHKDILEEIRPQITNNCSESLNSSLKKYYSWSFIPKYKLAEGKIRSQISIPNFDSPNLWIDASVLILPSFCKNGTLSITSSLRCRLSIHIGIESARQYLFGCLSNKNQYKK